MRKSLAGLLCILFVGFVYYQSPVEYAADSAYSLLMDQSLLEHGSPNMFPYQIPHGKGLGYSSEGYLYTLTIARGRLLYVYPWGGALLALPGVAVFEAAGFKVAPAGVYDAAHEIELQRYLATALCALVAWMFFDAAAVSLPVGWSFLIAIGAALGTPIWSTASRSLWAQTWNLFLVTIAIWLFVKRRRQPIFQGTVLAWACYARPQAIPISAVIGIYALLEYGWRQFVILALTVGVWGAFFGWIMLHFFGQLIPLSYQEGLDFPHQFLYRLEGVLVSPSRGLFVFVPIALLPVYLTGRYWRVLPQRRLAILSISAITVQVAMTSSWICWWGGGSYGPRLLLETIPWFVLLAVAGIRAFLEDGQLTKHECAAVISTAILLLIASVAMNGAGAMSPSTISWNAPVASCQNPDSQWLWQWRHPQFLAWAPN